MLPWSTYLGQFRCEIMHIPRTDSCSNDLLSTWRDILHDTSGEGLGSVPLRAIDLFACADADYYFIVDERRQSELAEGAGDVGAEEQGHDRVWIHQSGL